jgi:Bacterial PH domain
MSSDLAPGEKVIWQGKPIQGIRFSPQDFFIIPFVVLWLFMVIFIPATAKSNQAEGNTPILLFIPFIFIGLYMAVGRFVFDIFTRRNTNYRLTSERAIIDSGIFRKTTRSINLKATGEVSISTKKNGSGTVVFGSGSGRFAAFPRNWPGISQYLPPAFDGIDDAKHVYELAVKTQRSTV